MTATVAFAANARPERYTAVAIVLHWLIAAAILYQVGLGLWMTHATLPQAQRFQTYQLHKSIGITVLLLVLLRILWRLAHPPPRLPSSLPPRERAAAWGAHLALYGFMLLLPLTGWAMVSASPLGLPTVLYGVVPWPHLPLLSTLTDKKPVEAAFKWVHDWGAWLLLGLIALHAAAALRHRFVLRDEVLGRMLPSGGRTR